ncbi:uncharacterized protein LOC113378161 [Ctenocephalides felis]|nr:uncharacterized protein LOC113378161 [Ctenocephalides felis]
MTVPRVNRGSPPSYSQAVANNALHRPSVITHSATRSLSMCDPIIEEHFRRSLGSDYEQYLMGPQAARGSQLSNNGMSSSHRPSASNLQRSKTISSYPLGKVKYCSEAPRRSSASSAVGSPSPAPPPHYPAGAATATAEERPMSEPADPRPSLLLRDSSLSVDDHFAKALGDTWLKIKEGQVVPTTTAAGLIAPAVDIAAHK